MNSFDENEVRRDDRGAVVQVRGTYALGDALGDAGGDREGGVVNFLKDRSDDLGLRFDDQDLEVVQRVDTPTISSLRYRQTQDGVPIFGTEVLVLVDNLDQICQINLMHQSDKRVSQDVGDTGAKLTARRAASAAKAAVGDYVPADEPSKPEAVYYPAGDELRLGYRIIISSLDPLAEWEIVIDAYTGEVLYRRDILMRMPDGQGLVFDPNPVVTSGDPTLRDPNAGAGCGFAGTPLATIEAERVSRTLRDLTLSGGTHKLDGPYIRIADFLAGAAAPPEEANANDFNYSSDSADFDAVNVYYHIDTIQRYLQNLGIATAHPNVIEADVRVNQSGASYSPFSDNMRFGDSGPCRPERASDGDVALHEYGHAIQTSQVPGWGGTNPVTGRNETGAMGEGFGDILACVFFAEHGGGFQREVFEDWIFGDVGGLRRVDGTKVYPTDWAFQVHSDGEIWSAALWNIYRAIGGDSAVAANRLAARDELLKTLVLSHHRMTANGTMPDGAEAFMDENAAQPEYRLTNGVEILDSFHDRGLLECAAGSDLRIGQLWSQQNEVPVSGWQQVEAGQDNWFYAEVTNHGATAARAFVVLFSFKSPFASPVYPADFRNNIISGAVGYDLAPGATTTVKARWPEALIPAIPAGATKRHGCILAEVYNPCDHVAPGVTTIGASGGHLKQRNTDIVDLIPGDTINYFIDLGQYAALQPEMVRLELIRDPRWAHAEVNLFHANPRFLEELIEVGRGPEIEVVRPPVERLGLGSRVRVVDPARIRIESILGGIRAGALPVSPLVFDLAAGSSIELASMEAEPAEVGEDFVRSDARFLAGENEARLVFNPGARVGFPMVLAPRRRALVGLQVGAPHDARPGDVIETRLEQRTRDGVLIGEWEIIVNVVADYR